MYVKVIQIWMAELGGVTSQFKDLLINTFAKQISKIQFPDKTVFLIIVSVYINNYNLMRRNLL